MVGRGIFNTINPLKTLARQLLDILLPPKCLNCAKRVESPHAICPDCWKDIHFISDPKCTVCGYPFGVEMSSEIGLTGKNECATCFQTERAYTKAISAIRYDDESRKMIIGFKHNDRLEYAQFFVNLLKIAGQNIFDECDIIVPVPLHRKRLLNRRYNQSAVLSRLLARELFIEHEPEALKRTKNTPPQQGNKNKRHLNVRGAFSIKSKFENKIREKRVLLIDDVYTTGATVEYCARALRRAGAEKIFVATVFRTVSPQELK